MRYVIAVFITLASFASTAAAADFADIPLDELVKPLMEAAKAGNWPWALAAALVLVTALMRRYGAKRWPFWAKGEGAALLLLLGSFGASLGTAFAAGQGFSWGLVWASVGVAVTAAGGYSLIKTLLVPRLLKLSGRFGWLAPVAKVLDYIFPDKQAQAAMAGDKAVAAAPSPGIIKNTPKGEAPAILEVPRDIP